MFPPIFQFEFHLVANSKTQYNIEAKLHFKPSPPTTIAEVSETSRHGDQDQYVSEKIVRATIAKAQYRAPYIVAYIL